VVTPHLGASTEEAQISVAVEAAHLLVDYFQRGQIRFAVNMPTLDRTELEDVRLYIDLARRLVTRAGKPVHLTPHEYKLLTTFGPLRAYQSGQRLDTTVDPAAPDRLLAHFRRALPAEDPRARGVLGGGAAAARASRACAASRPRAAAFPS